MKKLYESGENYLEAIMVIKKEKGAAFSIDVANHLGFSKASVSRAMKILTDEGYIQFGSHGAINFTPLGEQRAKQILERHQTIHKFLTDVLNISNDIAESDACRIEHVISNETFEAIKKAVTVRG